MTTLRERLRTKPPLLELRDIRVRFGGLLAVDVDHMVIREGRIVGLIGANGAGKTTLFDVISGFVRPETGSLLLRGEVELAGLPPSARALEGLGRSFQNATLFESMTVAETLAVAFERRMRGLGVLANGLALPWYRRTERAVQREVSDLVDLMGLGAFHDKFISELSTGSRRMVDLACILAHKPTLLLLDEPSSGIAQREVEALGALLRKVKSDLGCTLVVVEHDIPMIRDLADELYALEIGSVIAHGTPAEVLSDPQVIHSYLGTDATVVERSGAGMTNGHHARAPAAKAGNGLADLTVAALREQARALAIPGRSRMRREDLIAAIGHHQDEEASHES